ncbi:MAG TPA: response regulator transcription factor [Edaphobacter sp.]|nr:response regulator transcription factor [Edaphobacter sp.]
MSRRRVLLVDDNTAILEQIKRTLEARYEIVGAVTNQAAALERLSLAPEIIVLDIAMGQESGIDLARRIVEVDPLPRIVFLTVYADQDFVLAALSAGALGYVVKPRLSSDLIPAIESAAHGEIFLSPPLTAPKL